MNTKAKHIISECSQVLLGKSDRVKLALIGLLSNGHIFIEDVPGVGKTTLVFLISRIFNLNLSRIQFTNDLLPADILGFNIFNKKNGDFEFKKGPIFGELILADELNRATPKTQSALLQVMEERSVTIEGSHYQLEKPFFILATQNPMQQIGTYPLPESQLDRFMLSFNMGFPEKEFEAQIIKGGSIQNQIEKINSNYSKDDLFQFQEEVEMLQISDKCVEIILNILEIGRESLEFGSLLSPRAGKDLVMASKANAYIEGRNFVSSEDICFVAPFVLGHRLAGGRGVPHGYNLVESLLKRVELL